MTAKRIRTGSSTSRGLGGLTGPRKPYSERPGKAASYWRCKFVVAQRRHGDPPTTCEGLVFEKGLHQHLLEVHGVPSGLMDADQLAKVFVHVADGDSEPFPRGHSNATTCDCGNALGRRQKECSTCLDRNKFRPDEPLTSTSAAKRAYINERREAARRRGDCGICCKRPTVGEETTCRECQSASSARYQARKERGL